jgi:hypothetical protein
MCALGTAIFADRDRQHAVAEVENLLDLVMVILPGRPVAHQEVTDRGCAVVDPEMRFGEIPHRVGHEETRECIEVPLAVHHLVKEARQLDQVGGRGLLGHQAGKYPACPSRPLCEGGCFTNLRRAHWSLSKGGFEKAASRRSPEARPAKPWRCQAPQRPSQRAQPRFSQMALCNSLRR